MDRFVLKDETRSMRAYLQELIIGEKEEILLMEHADVTDLAETVYLAIETPVSIAQRIIMSKVFKLPQTSRPATIIHAYTIRVFDKHPNGSVMRDVMLQMTGESDHPEQCGASVAFVGMLTPLQSDYTQLTTSGEIAVWNSVFNWRAACLRGGGVNTVTDLPKMHPQIFGVAS